MAPLKRRDPLQLRRRSSHVMAPQDYLLDEDSDALSEEQYVRVMVFTMADEEVRLRYENEHVVQQLEEKIRDSELSRCMKLELISIADQEQALPVAGHPSASPPCSPSFVDRPGSSAFPSP